MHHTLNTCCTACVKYIQNKEDITQLSDAQRVEVDAATNSAMRAERAAGRLSTVNAAASDASDDSDDSDWDCGDGDSDGCSDAGSHDRRAGEAGNSTWRKNDEGQLRQLSRGRGSRGVTRGRKLCDMSREARDNRVEMIVDAVAYLTQEGKKPSQKSLNLLSEKWGGHFVSAETEVSMDSSFHHSKRHWEEERRLGSGKHASVRRFDRRGRWRGTHAGVNLIPAEHLPPGMAPGHAVYVDFEEALEIVLAAHASSEWFEDTEDLVIAECADGTTTNSN